MDEIILKQAIINRYILAYNNFDVPGMLVDLHEAIVFRNTSKGEITHESNGKQEFENIANQGLEYFSKRKQSVLETKCNEDCVLIKVYFEAVVKNDLPNGLQKGQVLKFSGESKFVFDGDKIILIEDIS